MNDVRPTRMSAGLKIALVGAGLAIGVIGATALGATAQTTAGTGTTASSAPGGSQSNPAANTRQAPRDLHGAAPVRTDEKALSAAKTAILKAAALKAVPGGTVYRVETDAGDGVYEAHMTKANGTEVTVKFNSQLQVTKVESGMGAGDPGPHR
jgi:uncharacterized membrane protein YkoI